ncbi:heavy metal translocating P-type ATPase [Agrococcus sediminis]|uniref:heavy metal translocating P-type ATPase n=1 Tax=Agrococcus sediminis TaxID=2599924 RepID=UPI0037FDEA13
MSLVALLRRYPLVAATLVVAAAGGLLALTPAAWIVPWVVGGWAAAMAARSAVGMVRDLLAGHAGIDLLAIVAVTATVLVGEHWAALIVVLMLTGGEALEDYAAHRARADLSRLLERAPSRAHIEREGRLDTVDVGEVAIGDVLVVKPNEIVPVDAVLLDVPAELDLSSLTGESLPVEVAVGGAVPSGAVNGAAAVRMRAERAAVDSQYQAIVRLVEQASEQKARTVRLADRYAVPFTVGALAIAGAAWWLSGDATRFAEVLVVATPCPLLIAAPVAFMAGMSRAARAGVVVKGGDVLERLARAQTFVFDKTGTLTGGEPQLEEVRAADPSRTLSLAAAAERYSTHALSGAVLRAAEARALAVPDASDARETATNGVEATVAGQHVVVGKRAYVERFAGAVPEQRLEPGQVAVYVAIGGEDGGALVLRDRLRPEAAATVAALRAGGAELLMLTGDARATAEHVGREVGIDRVQADCLPADKVEAVRGATRRPVVMVGDGINDAPVLAVADVGIAMGARGATAASDSADAVVLVEDVGAVERVARIARDTVRIALQSIWLGIAISVGLMAVAALGHLPAIAGAWLQELVDLIAILGALRALGPRRERHPGPAVERPGAPAARSVRMEP